MRSPRCRQTTNSPPPTRHARRLPGGRPFSSAIRGISPLPHGLRQAEQFKLTTARVPAGRSDRRLPAQDRGGSDDTRRQGGRSRLRSRRASDRLRPGRGAACREGHRLAIELDHHLLPPTALSRPHGGKHIVEPATHVAGSRTESSARLARPRTNSGGSGGTGKISANHLCHCTADRVRQNEDVVAPVQTAECSPRHREIADDRRSRAHRGMRLSRASRAPVRLIE